MDEGEEKEWLVFQQTANHTLLAPDLPQRRFRPAHEIPVVMTVCITLGVFFGVVCFLWSNRQERRVRDEREEKRESRGKNLAKSLTPRKWDLEKTEQMSLSCWEETDSFSGNGDDATIGHSDSSLEAGHLPSFNKRKSSDALEKSRSNILQTCQVCSADFCEGDDILQSNNPNCGHVFHKACMEKWLNYQYSCPICGQIYAMQQKEYRLSWTSSRCVSGDK